MPNVSSENFNGHSEVKEDEEEVKAMVTKKAPYFEGPALYSDNFTDISLNDYRGKYLILLFYHLDFSFICPTEIRAFSSRVEEFRKFDCEIVGCSVDSKYTHLAWTSRPVEEGGVGKIAIPLLSDIKRKISMDYGVYSHELGHSLRGFFLIDPNGIIRQIIVNDLSVGRSTDEALRLLKAIKYHDETGLLCGSDWRPGDKSIKALRKLE